MNLESNNATLKIITNKDNITLKDDSYHLKLVAIYQMMVYMKLVQAVIL